MYDPADDARKSTNTCVECGREYWVKPYRRGKTRFCSFECSGRFRAKETLNVGSKPYMRGNQLRKGLRPANAFTSERTSGESNPNWKNGIERVCEHCGASFQQKPWLARQNGVARFCGRECFEASGCFVEGKSPSYVGGPTTYRGRGWLKARAAVVAEQNGECADCGKCVGASLPVHHIRPFREFATSDEANRRENLIGLCQSCHMRAERQADLFVAAPAEKPVQQPLFGAAE
jgi:hypothetical protein